MPDGILVIMPPTLVLAESVNTGFTLMVTTAGALSAMPSLVLNAKLSCPTNPLPGAYTTAPVVPSKLTRVPFVGPLTTLNVIESPFASLPDSWMFTDVPAGVDTSLGSATGEKFTGVSVPMIATPCCALAVAAEPSSTTPMSICASTALFDLCHKVHHLPDIVQDGVTGTSKNTPCRQSVSVYSYLPHLAPGPQENSLISLLPTDRRARE